MSRIRLICPNCGAQYEVPLEVIPEAGRDVQCSSCQHTWFQHHPDFAPEPEPEPEPAPPPAPKPAVQSPAPPPAQSPTPPPAAPDTSAEADPERYDDAEPDPAAAPVPPRPLPPEIAEVFAEERAFETSRRHAEGGVLETQPDLGLEPPEEDLAERRAAEARAHREALRAPTEPKPRPPEPPVSRRGRLPDVEEITETLRSNDPTPRVIDSAERAHLDETEDSAPRGGFARGFFIAILLAALGLAVYASAPQIAEAAPALAAPLDSYVAAVDQARGWLDGQMAEWLGRLDGMSSQAAPDANG